MDGKVLAICDSEQQYAVRLMEAFCEKKQLGFQIYVFSESGKLEAFLEQTQVEILLISGKMMKEEIGRRNIGKIILLSDGEIYERFEDYESIYKYQSAEYIIKELLCYYAEFARPVMGRYQGNKKFEIHGVYSPIGRCGKTILAEGLAKNFAKQRKTLLIDLQSFSAFEEQLGEEELWDLSDIIYFLRQGKKTLLYKLDSIVKTRNDFDYILPMKTPADIRSVTLSEWTELFERLAYDTGYEVVVVDFGEDVCGLFQLLSQCTKVYAPVLQDEASQKKWNNFEWALRYEDFKILMEQIQKIDLPENFDFRGITNYMNDWIKRQWCYEKGRSIC